MKRIGEAATPEERCIEEVVGAVMEWRQKVIQYEPVGGGMSNSNWRVAVEGAPNDYFVKVPGQGTEMFIDRRTANEASIKAAQTGYGAQVFTFIDALGVEIFEFMDGWRASSNRDFLNPVIRHNALAALKAFNTQSLLKQTVFDMIDEHQAQVTMLSGMQPADNDWLLEQYRHARQALEASGIALTPCMNDTLAGNFMLNDRQAIRLVDFEYASNNDRHYELALWFGEMFFPPSMEIALLEDYFGKVTPQILARIAVYKALADLKWSTWAMVQQSVSRLDFDFYKYGIWKHMRARSVMQDSRWEMWLKQV